MQLLQTYAAIIFRYDPVTCTDYVSTRRELISGSLEDAKQDQQKLLDLELEPGYYRSYIQCRLVLGKKYQVQNISNLLEVCTLGTHHKLLY